MIMYCMQIVHELSVFHICIGPSGSIDPGKAESLPRGATNTIRPTTVKATRAFDSNETLRILKKKMMSAKSSRELFDVSWVYFVDSGGQPQFVDVLPRIVQSEALYLVVINLNQDLNAKQKSCYHLNGEEYTLPDTLALSNKELIERTCQIAESSKDCKMVLVVGTRLDKVNTDQIDKINQELLKLHKKYEKVLVPADDIVNNKFVLPVNAMAEGEERIKYRKMLQTCLLSVIDRIVTRKEVPVKWFIYQMDINEKAMSSGGVVAKSECNEIGKMLEMSDDEVESSLKFFNKLAVHLYSNASNFPPKVIVQMDPLVERLSCLIRSSFQPPKHFPTYMFSLLRLCGLFYQSIFLKIFSDITDNALSNEEFLQILEHLQVVAKYEEDYFLPCALSVGKVDVDCDLKGSAVFEWNGRFLPPGIFNTLIIQLIKLKDGEFAFTFPPDYVNYQSRERIQLTVPSEGTVILDNHHTWIAVHSSLAKEDCKVYSKILLTIFNILSGLLEETTELRFTCPVSDDEELHLCCINKKLTHSTCTIITHQKCLISDNMKSVIDCMSNCKFLQKPYIQYSLFM